MIMLLDICIPFCFWAFWSLAQSVSERFPASPGPLMSLFLARPGPFLNVLSHCQDSQTFWDRFWGFKPVPDRFWAFSIPLQTVSKVVELLQCLKAIDPGFHFLRQFVPSLVYSLLFPLKFSTATRKLSCIPIGCNLTSALPTNLSTLSCTLLLMELRCGGAL